MHFDLQMHAFLCFYWFGCFRWQFWIRFCGIYLSNRLYCSFSHIVKMAEFILFLRLTNILQYISFTPVCSHMCMFTGTLVRWVWCFYLVLMIVYDTGQWCEEKKHFHLNKAEMLWANGGASRNRLCCPRTFVCSQPSSPKSKSRGCTVAAEKAGEVLMKTFQTLFLLKLQSYFSTGKY